MLVDACAAVMSFSENTSIRHGLAYELFVGKAWPHSVSACACSVVLGQTAGRLSVGSNDALYTWVAALTLTERT